MSDIVFFVAGCIASAAIFGILLFLRSKKEQNQASEIVTTAKERAREIRKEAESDRKEYLANAKESLREDRERANEIETKLIDSEKRLEQRETKLENKLDELVRKTESLDDDKQAIKDQKEELATKKEELAGKLSEMAKMSVEDAKTQLFTQIEDEYEQDFVGRMNKKKVELESREEEMCREILVNAMQQYAGAVTTDTTQTTFKLDEDDMKGRIIGKEGRNITTFEKETGVSLIIDDTPNTVFISSFDLFRRYIAKKSLEDLIQDKRIQPARIEEIVQKNKGDADKLLLKLGNQILTEMGITGWPKEIISLIGKLRFRTSYGQNILKHSLEVAYIAESIAKQVGADARVALEGGILHDMGKALDHDIEGTHPEIGGKILRRHSFSDKLINITEGHHGAVEANCIETQIIMIADAISAVRPGARRANAEEYVKRLKEMEALVIAHDGVEKCYALSAGREVRVFVNTRKIGDLEAQKMAKDVAKDIQDNLQYPGEVKVTIIRENRFTDYAR